MIPRSLFDTLDSRWHGDVLAFIDTGDASGEFLEFLNQDTECQRVVDIALTLVAQDVLPYLRSGPPRFEVTSPDVNRIVAQEPGSRERTFRAILNNRDCRVQIEGILTESSTH